MPPILHHASRLPWPTNWDEIFGRSAPLLIEIGFGGGDSLVDWARTRPDANILGLEISLPSLRRAVKKIKNARLTNVRVAQGNARMVLQALCAPASVGEMTINFPDPWPKERHHRRRLISDGFLRLAATRLVPGGRLNIATDHAGYAQWITERLERTPYFTSRLPATYVTEDAERVRTKYELIALEDGRPCHYFKWRRNNRPAANIFPIPEEFPMPHVVLRTPLTLAEIGRQFEPQQTVSGDIHIRLLEMYQSFHHPNLLVEIYVDESPLSQRAGLSIRQRETGELVISLHDVGFPRPTRGVQLAIAHLAQWIAELHPETEVAASNLGDLMGGA